MPPPPSHTGFYRIIFCTPSTVEKNLEGSISTKSLPSCAILGLQNMTISLVRNNANQLYHTWINYFPHLQELSAEPWHTLQTLQVKIKAFCAAPFWSWLWAFFNFSCFCWFFCCDWNFWWPRAIVNKTATQINSACSYTV